MLGTSFYAGRLTDAAELVIDRALSGAGGYATQTGVHGVTLARRDAAERAALDASWMNFPDGAPVAWRQRRAGAARAERVGGPDVMAMVIDRGRERGVRHFLLGSTEPVLAALHDRLGRMYPGAEVCGTLSPPFRALTADDEAAIEAAVAAARPHIVWVGLGAPKQDLWCHDHAPRMAPALCVGVGAAFDFLAGTKQRAPRWMQRAGLEWLHRMASEPAKLGPRYLKANTSFIGMSLAELARGGRERAS